MHINILPDFVPIWPEDKYICVPAQMIALAFHKTEGADSLKEI